MPTILKSRNITEKQYLGLTHFAIKAGSIEKVDKLTSELQADGFNVVSEPRKTCDGFYESVILDPEGNRVEIVA